LMCMKHSEERADRVFAFTPEDRPRQGHLIPRGSTCLQRLA
jgi:hypothetical protein